MKHYLFIEFKYYQGLAEHWGHHYNPIMGQWMIKQGIIKGTWTTLIEIITEIIKESTLIEYFHCHFARWEDLDELNKSGRIVK